MFCEEVVAWKHLDHRNIVPFLGATLDPPQLVSVWMPGEDLMEYVIAHPEKNRLGLVSFLPALSGEVFTLFASYTMSPKAWNTSTAEILFTGTSKWCVDANHTTPTY